jgi:GNAT superfamily N-acetyltransferase
MSPLVAEWEARRVCREPGPDHAALLVLLDGEVVGCGTYGQAGAGSRSAEVAFTVADDMHNRGIAMLLLEHLVSLARRRGLRAFTAETLSENAAMLRVFADGEAGISTMVPTSTCWWVTSCPRQFRPRMHGRMGRGCAGRAGPHERG